MPAEGYRSAGQIPGAAIRGLAETSSFCSPNPAPRTP